MSDQTKKLAEDHVDWLLALLRPLLISEFEHGYKHGREDVLARYNMSASAERIAPVIWENIKS